MNLTEHIAAVEDGISGLKETVEKLQGTIDDLNEGVRDANEEKASALKKLADTKEQAAAATDRINTRMNKLVGEEKELTAEVGILREKKADLLVANAQSDKRIKAFKEYELNARKMLEAKDESLAQREQVVRDQEQMIANRNRVLPNLQG